MGTILPENKPFSYCSILWELRLARMLLWGQLPWLHHRLPFSVSLHNISTSIMYDRAWSIWDTGTLLLALSQPAAFPHTPNMVGISSDSNVQPAGKDQE